MEDESVSPGSFEGLRKQGEADEAGILKSLSDLSTRYLDLYDHAPVSYFSLNNQGVIHEVNFAAAQLFGSERQLLAGQLLTSFIHPADHDIYHRGFQTVIANGSAHQCELRLLNRSGAPFWACLDMDIGVAPNGENVRRVVLFDISKRKVHETRKAFLSTILGVLNEPLEVKETITRILKVIKRETGFAAVGIRLHNGEDYPYFVSDGFSEEFIARENALAGRAPDGSICLEKNGSLCLECTCGMVIAGKCDPLNSFVTPGKSFWTNNALSFLDIPADEDPRLNPRNCCISEGFHSIALIPVFSDKKIVGLLQLNDREKDRLTLDMVDFLEEIAESIGVALKRKQMEDSLRRNEERQRLILNSEAEAISKRRQAESLLRISEGRYRSVVEDQTELICRYRPDGKLSFVNEAYARYYEKSVRDLIDTNFVPKIPAPDLQMIGERLAAIDPEHPVAIIEHRIITTHGEVRWQCWTHRKIYGFNGRLIESQATGSDITARRRAEEALAASLRQTENEKLRTQAIIAMIGDGISIQDPDFKITYQNEAHIRSMGNHAGEYCYKAYEHHDQICADCPLALTFRDGRTHRSERTVDNNGSVRHFEVVTSPLKNADGHVIAGIEAVREITERKKIEEARSFLVKCGYQENNMEFFPSLAKYLAEALDMDFVCIDKLREDGQAETLAVYSDGAFEENTVHSLEETPCGDVAGRSFCCFPRDVWVNLHIKE